ncbi:hypothetical protein DFH07DRAFT_549663 [Mycena maculata]|uniref:Uncharacterized protein n=1 Tax=Mycena maculata TaxID=230809 RepID=A0AAD7IUH5_9AGAR|nr:hypothetical protein DFH07DRAFT_549663 [Mycena maculata]
MGARLNYTPEHPTIPPHALVRAQIRPDGWKTDRNCPIGDNKVHDRRTKMRWMRRRSGESLHSTANKTVRMHPPSRSVVYAAEQSKRRIGLDGIRWDSKIAALLLLDDSDIRCEGCPCKIQLDVLNSRKFARKVGTWTPRIGAVDRKLFDTVEISHQHSRIRRPENVSGGRNDSLYFGHDVFVAQNGQAPSTPFNPVEKIIRSGTPRKEKTTADSSPTKLLWHINVGTARSPARRKASESSVEGTFQRISLTVQ